MKRRVKLTHVQSECEREGEMGVRGGDGRERDLHTPIAVST